MRKRIIIIVTAVIIAAAVTAVLFFVLSKPAVSLTGEARVLCEINGVYTDSGATAKYAGMDISDKICAAGEVNTALPGEYTITYSVEIYGKTAEAVRSVIVEDDEAPVITLNGESEIHVQQISDFTDEMCSASDNCDGDLSAKVTVEQSQEESGNENIQIFIYTYTVTDSSGNSASATRKVVAEDTEAPVISVNGYSRQSLLAGGIYKERGASAEDNVDGTVKVSIRGSVDASAPGTYKVTYEACDKAGNKAQTVRTVTVMEPLVFSASSGGAPQSGSSNIALTFDDGPSANNTPRILDILREYNVKATFFIINYSDSLLPVIRRILDEGHTIGIHSMSHDYSVIYASPDAFMENIYSLQKKLYADTGYGASIIRFPGGSSNTVSRKYCSGIMSELTSRVSDEGFSYFDWNVDSGDASGNKISASRLISNTESGLKTGRTNVVLMHDSSVKTTTPDALSEIINYGLQNGYTFIPLSSSVPAVHHRTGN